MYKVSPNGQKIAWIPGENTKELRIANLDGSLAKLVTDDCERIGGRQAIAWSPDSQYLAFTVYNGHGPLGGDLWVVKADGSDPHPIATTERERSTQTPVHAGNPHAPNEHQFYQGGAVLARTHNLPWPPFTPLSVENSWSQSYWLNPAQQTDQNTITQAHRDAIDDTLLVRVFRSDWDYACAKYFANCGNPTANSSKWDMVKEGVTWFSWQQHWPTQEVTGNVQQAPGMVLPARRYAQRAGPVAMPLPRHLDLSPLSSNLLENR